MMRTPSRYEINQHQRFLRPDARRWMRPDAVRYLDLSRRNVPEAFKYDEDQPRDDRGRWTDVGGGQDTDEARSDETLVQDILAKAENLILAGNPADYKKCLDLCYPVLERFSPRWSDRNTWDFHKCMNACLGLNR